MSADKEHILGKDFLKKEIIALPNQEELAKDTFPSEKRLFEVANWIISGDYLREGVTLSDLEAALKILQSESFGRSFLSKSKFWHDRLSRLVGTQSRLEHQQNQGKGKLVGFDQMKSVEQTQIEAISALLNKLSGLIGLLQAEIDVRKHGSFGGILGDDFSTESVSDSDTLGAFREFFDDLDSNSGESERDDPDS